MIVLLLGVAVLVATIALGTIQIDEATWQQIRLPVSAGLGLGIGVGAMMILIGIFVIRGTP